MTTLTTIVGDILTASNTATVTNKTINRANNTLTVRLANDVSGTLPIANGGTGQTSCFSEGQLLIGNTTGNTLTKATLTGGNDICVTNGNGTITIDYAPPIVYNNSAWTWGAGGNGSRGDNTNTGCVSSPVSVVGGFTDWSQISIGANNGSTTAFGLGLRTNGTAWAWGYGGHGRLGDGTTTNRSSPVSVVGGFTDWCQVSASRNDAHSLGLRSNGTIWSWGCNGSGRLGDGTTTNRSSPVSVVGGFTDWSQLFAGSSFSLAIRTNGTLWSWGAYGFGRLGDNTYVSNRSSPVSVVGGFTDWCQISAFLHSVAVRTNGTLWSWGYNTDKQVGDGTDTFRSSPVSVIGGFTDWCHAAAGSRHSLGLRTNGTLYAWGKNNFGQLGDNTTVSKSSPVSVIGGFTDWCQLSANYQSLGVRTNGTLWSWGRADTGQLGDNTTVSKSSPVSVIGGFTDWCQVSATYGGSAGIRSTAT